MRENYKEAIFLFIVSVLFFYGGRYVMNIADQKNNYGISMAGAFLLICCLVFFIFSVGLLFDKPKKEYSPFEDTPPHTMD